jgi:hypothetical protein
MSTNDNQDQQAVAALKDLLTDHHTKGTTGNGRLNLAHESETGLA